MLYHVRCASSFLDRDVGLGLTETNKQKPAFPCGPLEFGSRVTKLVDHSQNRTGPRLITIFGKVIANLIIYTFEILCGEGGI